MLFIHHEGMKGMKNKTSCPSCPSCLRGQPFKVFMVFDKGAVKLQAVNSPKADLMLEWLTQQF